MSMLLTICALHFIAQLTPGPDVLLIAKSAAANRNIDTFKIILGITVGVVVWVVLTLLGFQVLIEQWPWIQQIIMVLGGIFLARMGVAMFKSGLASFNQSTDLNDERPVQRQNYFLLGLMTNLSNPKIVIYFSSVFSLALSSNASNSLKAELAFLIPLQTILTFSLLMFILSRPKIKQIYQYCSAYIDLISGGLFMLFAIWLWLDVWRTF
ncbi:LysE family transporter [Acinetobacter larvae]|uniref:Threonine transporter RhtB n=1 Tax=Acinetobacter larvae TaxID=1789224 RepID=A0A1B2M0J0_9GAMM|nr:LysE family transporter [Acinetobacter larvae]AOA58724.1 threonine transporter RhtB [Acinetobacter larvae]